MALEQEEAFYQQIRADLVAAVLNQFVLIKGSELVGVFPTYDEAFNAGAAQFGEELFLVKQVLDPEPVETI